MSRPHTRRMFLKDVGLSAAALAAAPFAGCATPRPRAPLTELRVACVGVGGMGGADMDNIAGRPGVKIVALCDVDGGRLAEGAKKHPSARTYADWRQMLDREARECDAVTVGTPDHMHAPIAMSAILRGKHVYVQKPLAHEIFEVRQLHRAARRMGVVTQMGIQCHSNTPYRQATLILRDGVIGRIKAVHVWSNRPGWPQGGARPAGADPVPKDLAWDLWLGVAPERPFVRDAYHPFKWRGILDFGTGALGDMGCHILDTPMAALKLGAPRAVRSEGPGVTADMHPAWEIVHYEFAGTEYTAGSVLPMTWYDGGRKPDAALAPLPAGQELPENGALFIGEKGVMLLPHEGGARLLPEGDFRGVKRPQVPPGDHWAQWVEACLGRGEPSAAFDFAAPLTEAVLLGTLSARFPGRRLAWDSMRLKVSGDAAATGFVRRAYRPGWEVEGLA